MKKTLLSLAALFAFGFANAQETESTTGFSQGDVFITGSFGFGSEKTGDFGTTEFNVSPSAGYFVSQNIALGLKLNYTSLKEDIVDDFGIVEQTSNGFAIGAFGRYYFTPSSRFSVFAELQAAYLTVNVEQEFMGDTVEGKLNGFGAQFAPGVSYFISDNLALEATFGILSYSTIKPDTDGAESTDTFELGVDMSDINFGLVYKF